MLVTLSEIIDILYQETIEEQTCKTLEILIEKHHHTFKTLYPSVYLNKKHHNMVQYPSSIRRIGSLVNYCTLRFGGKHVFFKSTQRVCRNFINVPLTLAKKHQVYLAQSLMNLNTIDQIKLIDGIQVKFRNIIKFNKLYVLNFRSK